MTKTLALKKVIKQQLDRVPGASYYGVAPDNAQYPYKVFDFQNVDLGDTARDDVILTVDIWDRATDTKAIETIADTLEDILGAQNLPTDEILPTIWRNSRRVLPDADKSIRRIELEFYIQTYKKGD